MSQATVFIKHGVYGKAEIMNTEFPLTKAYDASKGYITVWGRKEDGLKVDKPRNCRIKVAGTDAFEYRGDVEVLEGAAPVAPELIKDPIAEYLENESEANALTRIDKTFKLLDKFTDAAIAGIIRGLIVVGPPGVGKSHGVEQQLKMANFLPANIGGEEDKYEVIKGSISPSMLYRKLYKHADADHCLVLDDCDIEDEEALNLLKAALDSCDKRMLSWFKDAKWLERDGIPEQFEFKGSIIFLTNIDFARARGKKATHLQAIVSRCHYMDMEIHSTRDKLLRIKQVVLMGNMLEDYGFSRQLEEELVGYIWDNKDKMRELSLRLVKKLADLVKAFPEDWKEMAVATLMLPSAKYEMLMGQQG